MSLNTKLKSRLTFWAHNQRLGCVLRFTLRWCSIAAIHDRFVCPLACLQYLITIHEKAFKFIDTIYSLQFIKVLFEKIAQCSRYGPFRLRQRHTGTTFSHRCDLELNADNSLIKRSIEN